MPRFTIIVLDSFGVGELPDAADFGDKGAHTLKHIKDGVGDLKIPNMESLGLYNIDGIGFEGVKAPIGSYGKAAEKCLAKDTISGHFEIAGLIIEKPFKTYEKFPDEIILKLEKRFGTKLIGNYAASGTEIIKVLGEEHVKTGYPIIYTSADSVLQLAMHEDVIPLEKQYEFSKIAREVMMGDYAVGRIITRPFKGETGNFYRTENRRDFAVDPPGPTVLDLLKSKGKDVIAVGKIEDIFNRVGITEADHTKNNQEGIESAIKYLSKEFDGLLFVNLVDFDMLYGHRNDPKGYAKALEYFDLHLPDILGKLKDDDILLITADHGCDPGFPGTDHTREYIPILAYGPKIKPGANIGIRETFADIAATAAEYFGYGFDVGKSFLKEIR